MSNAMRNVSLESSQFGCQPIPIHSQCFNVKSVCHANHLTPLIVFPYSINSELNRDEATPFELELKLISCTTPLTTEQSIGTYFLYSHRSSSSVVVVVDQQMLWFGSRDDLNGRGEFDE